MQKDYSSSQTCESRQAKYRAPYADSRVSATIAAAQEDESSRRREAEILVAQHLRAAGYTSIARSRFDELVDEALTKSTEQPTSLEEAHVASSTPALSSTEQAQSPQDTQAPPLPLNYQMELDLAQPNVCTALVVLGVYIQMASPTSVSKRRSSGL